MVFYSPNGFLRVCLKKKLPLTLCCESPFQASVASAHYPALPHGVTAFLQTKQEGPEGPNLLT